MLGLGFPHMKPTIQELIRQHLNWTIPLSEEIRKAEKLIKQETLAQNRRNDRRDIGRKNET